MASADAFEIAVHGLSCHASAPERGRDPAIPVAQIIQAFQTVVSRDTSCHDRLVVTISRIHMGDADNIISDHAVMSGTLRSLSPEARQTAKRRMREICTGIQYGTGCAVHLNCEADLPVTVNAARETALAAEAARRIAGAGAVDKNTPPIMAAEDFAYMLRERPGAMIFLGNGDSAALHNSAYDFDDRAIAYGCAYFASVAETVLALT